MRATSTQLAPSGYAPQLERARPREPLRPAYRFNRTGVTVLLVEQNVRRALALAHRACVLENGRLVLAGPAQDLLASERLKKAYLGL